MSLRIWLPLNGGLNNQGLEQTIAINNGAIINEEGKIGKCYQFNGSTSFIDTNYNIPNFALDKTYSVAFWIYSTNTSGIKPIIGIGPDWGWTIFQQDNDIRFVQWDEEGNRWGNPYVSNTIEINTWVHIVLIWKKRRLFFYKNGQEIGDWMAPTDRTIKVASDTIKIGGNIYAWGTNYFSGKLNDVRIYDHALSPLEVKQISQGLILHYPLNRNGWGQENLLPCGGIYTQSSPWTTTLNRTDGYAFVTNSGFEATPGKTYTISVECDGNLYSAHHGGEIHNPSDKRWTFWAYISNINTTANWQNGGYDTPRNLTSSNNNYRKIGNTHVWTITLTDSQKYIGLRTNSYSNGTDNVTIKWWNMKVEEGDTFTGWSPNSSSELGELMNLNSTIEYDTSGYCNNGTRIGTFNWIADTPKYSVSTAFEKGIISIPNSFVTTVDPIFSISLWFKLKSGITYTAYTDLISFSSSSYSNQPFRLELCGTPVGKTIMWFRGPSGQSGGFAVKTDISTDEWYHTALVSEGNKQYSYYVNGEKLGTYNGSANSWTPTGNVFLGENINGVFYESDVRIYATALSTEDVKSLYQNSAYIDNQGNIYGAVYEEV